MFNKLSAHKKIIYDSFVIMKWLPMQKVILLDKVLPGSEDAHGIVYENFEKDIYGALQQALELLSKYHTIKIIFPAAIFSFFQLLLSPFLYFPSSGTSRSS
jgi:hypothetical protein